MSDISTILEGFLRELVDVDGHKCKVVSSAEAVVKTLASTATLETHPLMNWRLVGRKVAAAVALHVNLIFPKFETVESVVIAQ